MLGSSVSLEQLTTRPQLWRAQPIWSMWDGGAKAIPFSRGPSSKDMQLSPYVCPAAPALTHPLGHIQHHACSPLCPSGHLHLITFLLLGSIGASPSHHLPPAVFIRTPPPHRHPPATSMGTWTAPAMGQEVFAWPCIMVWYVRAWDHTDYRR